MVADKCMCGGFYKTVSIKQLDGKPRTRLRWVACNKCHKRYRSIECPLTQDDLEEAYTYANRKIRRM